MTPLTHAAHRALALLDALADHRHAAVRRDLRRALAITGETMTITDDMVARATVQGWDAFTCSTGTAVHPMFSSAFKYGYRAALAAQPQGEPVAWGLPNTALTGGARWMMLRESVPAGDQYRGALWKPLYTAPTSAPPMRVPLTDEQIAAAMTDGPTTGLPFSALCGIARAVERAHGIGGEPQPVTLPAQQAPSLVEALRFYAQRDHFIVADDDAWDTVSGEPPNMWCDEAGTATVEDGSVARAALAAAGVTREPVTLPALTEALWLVIKAHEHGCGMDDQIAHARAVLAAAGVSVGGAS